MAKMLRITRRFYSENDLDDMGFQSRSTRWRMRRKGEFPDPVRLSTGRVAYVADQIDKLAAELSGQPLDDAA